MCIVSPGIEAHKNRELEVELALAHCGYRADGDLHGAIPIILDRLDLNLSSAHDARDNKYRCVELCRRVQSWTSGGF